MKVFISYSSYDRWVARKIAEDLKRERISTFLDEKDIETGASIDESIALHLKDADELLLLLSPASLKSTWVFIELGGARALGKRVAPILLHVGANEVPQPISHSLCRDINDIDKYYDELAIRRKSKSPTGDARESITESINKDSIFNSEPNIAPPAILAAGDKIKIKSPKHISIASKQLHPVWVAEMDVLAEQLDVISLVRDDGVLFMENNDWAWLPDWVEKI